MTDILKKKRSSAKIRKYHFHPNNLSQKHTPQKRIMSQCPINQYHPLTIFTFQESTFDEKIDIDRYKEEYVNLAKSIDELLSTKKKEALRFLIISKLTL
jgi:hypothetical protein